MEKRRDLIINGIGSTNGGHFDTVKLNGNGTINGEVVCTNFESNGTGMDFRNNDRKWTVDR
jgi:hypothetical protein